MYQKNNKLMTIPLKEIDINNLEYFINYPADSRDPIYLFKGEFSYSPVLLTETDSGYTVVEGFNRINQLIQMPCSYVDAIILDDKDSLSLFTKGLLHRISFSSFNIIEQSSIITKLKKTYHLADRDIIENYLPILHENPSQHSLEALLSLDNLAGCIKNYVVENNIAAGLCLEFVQYSVREQEYLYSFIQKTKPGVNKLKIMLESLRHIIRRDNITITELLSDQPFTAVQQNEETSSKSLLITLIDLLSKIRYPEYHSHKSAVRAITDSFRLPPRWKISTPANYEGQGIELSFKIRDIRDYESAIKKLNDIYEDHSVKKLFEIL